MVKAGELGETTPPRIYLTSVCASLIVVLLAPFEVERGERVAWRKEWFSFWTTHPSIPPDELHGRAFAAWLRVAYPLIAITAIGMWLFDTRWPGIVTPEPFFTVAIFALSSGVIHFARYMSNIPQVTTSTQVIAGWPTELVLLGIALGISRAIFGT